MILHSQIFGSGKPFIILHGFLGMGDNWKSLGLRWAESGYKVHLLDLRNHGRSFHSDTFSYKTMADDVKNYCTEHHIEELILLGHSMGGKVAMQFAGDFPEMVSKLIVADIGPQAYPLQHEDILGGLAALDFSEIKSRGEAEAQLSKYIKEEDTRLFVLKNLYRDKNKKLALRLNLPVLSQKNEAVGEALAKEIVFSGDTLFLKGSNSKYIRPQDEVLIKKHFPNALIKEVSDAGHWLHAENPDEFYDLSMSFIENN